MQSHDLGIGSHSTWIEVAGGRGIESDSSEQLSHWWD
jgi:hypothetical protein